METGIGYEFPEVSGAMPAFFERLVGKFLQRLFDLAALATLIFVQGHFYDLQKNVRACFGAQRRPPTAKNC